MSGFKADISTPYGRREVASLAADIASSKMNLIRLGKSLTEGWRTSTKAVNEECNLIEERMDALKSQVRAPLTAWENIEKARVAEHERLLTEIVAAPMYGFSETSAEIRQRKEWLLQYPIRDWQEFSQRFSDTWDAEILRMGRLLNATVKSEAEDAEAKERERIEDERQRVEREALIAQEAAMVARQAAEKKAEAEAQAVAHRAEVERAALENARLAAEQRAILAAASAAVAEQKAESAQLAGSENERQRAAQAKAGEDAAAKAREKNVAHRKTINGEALAALVHAGLTSDQGRIAITAITKGEIPHVSIAY